MTEQTAHQPDRIYRGQVMHRRYADRPYRFSYAVFSILLDIDRLQETAASLHLFGYNRGNLFSFHDSDHGPRDGSPLRPWVETNLARYGIDLDGGQIQLLCFPRVLGYVFNPLSVWYCRHRDGSLRAVLCEVSNTFGERHSYLLHRQGSQLPLPVRDSRAKCFHVSPFLPMHLRYHFRISDTDRKLSIAIRCTDAQTLRMAAVQTGTGLPLSDAALLRSFVRIPMLTLKVMVMIHWQALKLFIRRTPFYTKPAAPTEELTS